MVPLCTPLNTLVLLYCLQILGPPAVSWLPAIMAVLQQQIDCVNVGVAEQAD